MSYLGLALSSNTLTACETGVGAQRESAFSEPRILVTVKPDSGAPLAPNVASPPAFRQDHFGYCYDGYKTSGKPALDLLRLGALCGPSNGMLAAQPRWTLSVQADAPALTVPLEAGDCVRVIAATTSPESFELEWREGDRQLRSCQQTSFGLCPPDGVVCSSAAGPVTLAVHSDGPLAGFMAEVWRLPGAR